MFNLPNSVRLCALALEKGGFTFRLADGIQPTLGYAVGLSGHERRYPNITPFVIRAYILDNWRLLSSDAGACIGCWYNSATNHWYLDISIAVPTHRAAVALGRAHNQLAVWDLAANEEIVIHQEVACA